MLYVTSVLVGSDPWTVIILVKGAGMARKGLEKLQAACSAFRTLEGHIGALIADGYEVTFCAGAGQDAFFVNLEKDGDPDAGCTAGGKTIAEALWTVSPLHDDDEPYPGCYALQDACQAPEIA
jgi:hypothetical protein